MEHVQRRRDAAAAAWDLTDEVVVIGAGRHLPIAGSGDQVYPLQIHPEYRYLADRAGPGEVLVFDAAGGWTQYAPEITDDERVWTGLTQRSGRPLSKLSLAGRTVANLGAVVTEHDEELTRRLREQLKTIRRRKDQVEIERIRAAVAATANGHAKLGIWPGMTEREIQIELEAGFFRAGGQRTGYDSIVGSGPNAAVLHSAPTSRPVGPGDLVLIDAGAEIDGYCADVTRTFVKTAVQEAIYGIVLAAERRAVAACRAGTEYRDIHMQASLDIAGGLVDFGILRGDPESLLERDAHALFFPHGIGHMVGLGVRDGDSAPDVPLSDRPGLRFLRLDCALEPGYLVTIEPGIYFIPAILNKPANRETYSDCIDWAKVDSMLDFGGVRIEDNVLVTDGAPEVLTAAIPK